MKIAVIGTGGVGGYFGGKLAGAGYDVSFLARGNHLEAIQQNGLYIKSIQGDFKLQKVKVFDSIKAIGCVDLIILAVKAWQIKDISKDLKSIVNRDTVILPLQNGVSAVDELKEQIMTENIIGGICRIISKIESPGVIHHFGIEPAILFGELDNSKTARINNIQTMFEKAGIKAKIPDDIIAEIWKKFIPICVSGLLAVTKTTYGELRTLNETRQMMIELLNEIFRLSQKIGIKIEAEFLEKAIAFIDTFPYDSTSSLTRDVWEGKKSEIEYQNGTVVKLGEKYNIDTPINKFVYHCILPMEIKAGKR
jgi:2-dehydropantoate 2-reductase